MSDVSFTIREYGARSHQRGRKSGSSKHAIYREPGEFAMVMREETQLRQVIHVEHGKAMTPEGARMLAQFNAEARRKAN